jgi:hypothetical protein
VRLWHGLTSFPVCCLPGLLPGGGARWDAGYTQDRAGQTAAVDTFTLVVALRPDRSLDDAAVDALGAAVRPGDDDLRIWREAGRGLLRVSTECSAEDLEAALELGHALGIEALAACPGLLLEVSALGDEDSLVWRAVP